PDGSCARAWISPTAAITGCNRRPNTSSPRSTACAAIDGERKRNRDIARKLPDLPLVTQSPKAFRGFPEISQQALPLYSSGVYFGTYTRAHVFPRAPDASVPDRCL